MEARAKAKFVRSSPRKTRQVLDLIRGKGVDSAEDILRLTNRPVARRIQKVLKSAVANAQHRAGLAEDPVEVGDLVVRTVYADPGPTQKRWLPRARGRATPILKRSCHITIVVSDEG